MTEPNCNNVMYGAYVRPGIPTRFADDGRRSINTRDFYMTNANQIRKEEMDRMADDWGVTQWITGDSFGLPGIAQSCDRTSCSFSPMVGDGGVLARSTDVPFNQPWCTDI